MSQLENGRGLHAPESRSWRDDAPAILAASQAYLDQNVSSFFYRWGGLLSSTLIRIRGRFQGDLDQYLIYLVFLLNDLSREISSKGRVAGRRPEARGLNALSIAEITGIPRETARRKLQMLVAEGYVDRAVDGLYYLGGRYGLDQFFFDLSPLFCDGLRAGAEPSVQPVQPQP